MAAEMIAHVLEGDITPSAELDLDELVRDASEASCR
jgi:hypothetical protein